MHVILETTNTYERQECVPFRYFWFQTQTFQLFNYFLCPVTDSLTSRLSAAQWTHCRRGVDTWQAAGGMEVRVCHAVSHMSYWCWKGMLVKHCLPDPSRVPQDLYDLSIFFWGVLVAEKIPQTLKIRPICCDMLQHGSVGLWFQFINREICEGALISLYEQWIKCKRCKLILDLAFSRRPRNMTPNEPYPSYCTALMWPNQVIQIWKIISSLLHLYKHVSFLRQTSSIFIL